MAKDEIDRYVTVTIPAIEPFTAPCMTDECKGMARLPGHQEAFNLHVDGETSIERIWQARYCPECLAGSTP